MNKCSDAILVNILRSLKFRDYSNLDCVNEYQECVSKFLSAVDSVASIWTLRVKFNAKPMFDIVILKAFWNLDQALPKI